MGRRGVKDVERREKERGKDMEGRGEGCGGEG